VYDFSICESSVFYLIINLDLKTLETYMPQSNYFSSPRPLALRTNSFQESVIREMTRLGDSCGAVNLSQGLPDFDPREEIIDAAIEAIRSGENQYTFPFGLPEFRQSIAAKSLAYNGIHCDPETEVTVTCGVSEAMMSTMLALTDPGDEVLILEPWYENYLPACRMAGAIPIYIGLREPDFTWDEKELHTAFERRPRLILINTPHNPTGRVFTAAELGLIARLCQQYGVIAVTDEIYEHIYYDDDRHLSLGSVDGMQDCTVTLCGLGKTYAVTGWRVGWAIAAEPISALIRKVHDYLTICAPAPMQKAGVAALNMSEQYYADMRCQYGVRRGILLRALRKSGFQFRTPTGAYYVMANFADLDWDRKKYEKPDWTLDRNFAEYMARDVGVAVVPGSSFYSRNARGNTQVRFNFAKAEKTLNEASLRLSRME
jgi:aspartate/methionine/tyrosine aminotransferase